jgi:hypothetical protein
MPGASRHGAPGRVRNPRRRDRETQARRREMKDSVGTTGGTIQTSGAEERGWPSLGLSSGSRRDAAGLPADVTRRLGRWGLGFGASPVRDIAPGATSASDRGSASSSARAAAIRRDRPNTARPAGNGLPRPLVSRTAQRARRSGSPSGRRWAEGAPLRRLGDVDRILRETIPRNGARRCRATCTLYSRAAVPRRHRQ